MHGTRETFGDRSAAVIEVMRVLDAVIATMQSDAPRIEFVMSMEKLPQRRLACSRCGAAFECGSGGGDGDACWCMDERYRLPMPEAGAGDCLCPACLRAEAAKGRTA